MTPELTWELATGKLPIEGMRLDKVMVFYHNDQEEGFGVGIDGSRLGSSLEADLQRAFDIYKRAWDLANEEHRQQILDHYLKQVEDAARHRHEIIHKPSILILILNIIWLSCYGRIPNDEYNGTQFIWASGPSVFVEKEERSQSC